MKFSTNTQWVGKPTTEKTPTGRPLSYNNRGQIVSLGTQWENLDEPFDTIFELLTVDGFAIAPELNGSVKNKTSVVSLQLFLVDIDHGMTIQQLLEDTFYQKYGAGYYSSPSHTDENPRFRILHTLQNRLTDIDDIENLYKALIEIYGGDPVCKDGSRMFFGTPNAPYKQITDKIIPDVLVRRLIDDQKSRQPKIIHNLSPHKYTNQQTDKYKHEIIEKLCSIFLGEYGAWCRVGSALRDGGYTVEDFITVTQHMMNSKTDDDARRIWNNWEKYQVSFGYVVNLLKQHGKIEKKLTINEMKKLTWGDK